VKIAVLDTGIDLTHPDMEARLDNIKGRANWTNRNFKNLVQDKNGHGTFTAGLILDYMPDAELYVAKIADNKPSSPAMIAEVSLFLFFHEFGVQCSEASCPRPCLPWAQTPWLLDND
jgi:subtilisin family serine protease